MFYLEDKYLTEEQQLLLIFYQQFLILGIQSYYESECGFSINNATLNRFFSSCTSSPHEANSCRGRILFSLRKQIVFDRLAAYVNTKL